MTPQKWGLDFSQIIYNPEDNTKKISEEDTDYILDKFIQAVEDRHLICGGGCCSVRLDIITCMNCLKNEALDGFDYCGPCLEELIREYKGEDNGN